MNVLLGVCGSIAAYKALELTRTLIKDGVRVKIILTKSGSNFVTPLSCQTLAEYEVYTDQFMLTKDIKHLALSTWADLLVIAPATANIIGKAASGIADDLLSTTILSLQKPILFVPAMDEGMWQNKIVQQNVEYLRKNKFHFLEPGIGLLASGKIGHGRFPSVAIIYKKILTIYQKEKSLMNKKFLITGGRTEEDLDLVRVITNRSSGMMAKEILEAIVCREGQAKGIFGETGIQLPEDIDILRVRTSDEMLQGLKQYIEWCDCLIMASAIGDYKPQAKSSTKIHSQKTKITFVKNRDLLKEISKGMQGRLAVGFSLEDRDGLKRAKEKLRTKKLDFVVLNSVKTIGSKNIEAQLLKKNGAIINFGRMNKWQMANKILDECVRVLSKK